MSQKEGLQTLTRRQFLSSLPFILTPEFLRTPEIKYGLLQEDLVARRVASTKAKHIGIYKQGVLLRYIPYEDGKWVQIIHDTYRRHPDWPLANGNIFVEGSSIQRFDYDTISPFPPHKKSDERKIEVDLSEKTLKAYINNDVIYEAPVSTGRRGYETPPGEYRILRKHWARHMQGIDAGVPWDLPGIPFVQYLMPVNPKRSFTGIALHGTYWHDRHGQENRSHGCINLRVEDSLNLFRFSLPELTDFSVEKVNGDESSTIVIVKQ